MDVKSEGREEKLLGVPDRTVWLHLYRMSKHYCALIDLSGMMNEFFAKGLVTV